MDLEINNQQSKIPSVPPRLRGSNSPAFTLMELMVSITILVLIILGVNMVFSGAANSVGISQATLEMMANVRAVNQLIQRDVAGMDKSCFLVIRCRQEQTQHLQSPGGIIPDPFPRRFDQISFIANGSFPNRSGLSSTNSSNPPFTENTVANAAHIWWGQMAIEKLGAAPASSFIDNTPPPNGARAGQSVPLAPSGVPGGAVSQLPQAILSQYLGTTSALAELDNEGAFVLGRHTTLLLPGPVSNLGGRQIVNVSGNLNGQGVPAYTDIDYFAYNSLSHAAIPSPVFAANAGNAETFAEISSSRISAAAITPSQIIQNIAHDRRYGTLPNNITPVADSLFEARHYCYRFKTLASIYDSELPLNENPTVNAYFRMTPITLQGASSFKIEWTDGTIDINGLFGSPGELIWYGPTGLSSSPRDRYSTLKTLINASSTLSVVQKLAMVTRINSQRAGEYISTAFVGGGGFGTLDASLPLGDDYIAIFSIDTPTASTPFDGTFNPNINLGWPKALRITYHLTDTTGRLKGGRDFVQIVNLP